MMVWVTSGVDNVWGVSANGDLWYRAGVDAKTPMGSNWFKINTGQGSNIEWKSVAFSGGLLWGLDKDEQLLARQHSEKENIEAGTSVSLFNDAANFKRTHLQEKPSSFVSLSGGWVVYEKPNFKGRQLFYFDGDCYSNDPANPKGPKLKAWQDPIGSVRAVRGLNAMVVSIRVELDWTKSATEQNTKMVNTEKSRNTSFKYQPAQWNRTVPVETRVKHAFELSEATEDLAGVSFTLEKVPKEGIVFGQLGTALETGTDFRQELSAAFTFTTDKSSSRERRRVEAVRMPSSLPPQTEVRSTTTIEEGRVKVPFKATFTSGLREWTTTGTYTGVDSTNIKTHCTEVYIGESTRKTSKL
jgi:hypothetical protein